MNSLTNYLRLKFGHEFSDKEVKVLCWLAYVARNPESDLRETYKEMVNDNAHWVQMLTSVATKTVGSEGIHEIHQWIKAAEVTDRSQRRQYFMDCIITKTVIPLLHEGAFSA